MWTSSRELAARLPPRPLTRFAPSPTGYLHLGHAANAIWVWGIARAMDGRVLLRLEDHDRGRCRSAYEDALLEDLEWLGFEPDLGTPAELRAGPSPHRQSDRTAVYEEALARLQASGRVYSCDCSRREMSSDGADAPDTEIRYNGRCRDRGLAPGIGRGLRLRLDPGEERFVDEILGEQAQQPALQCGDLLLRDRNGNWTYQFAVTVDDSRQDIDFVVRGADLLGSTGRQLRLARMLGRVNAPLYVHHPLIRKSTGAKLSKSEGDTGIRELRAAGHSPEAVLGRAACLVGLLGEPRPLGARDVAGLFDRSHPE